MGQRTCKRCGKEKSAASFKLNKTYSLYCKPCRKINKPINKDKTPLARYYRIRSNSPNRLQKYHRLYKRYYRAKKAIDKYKSSSETISTDRINHIIKIFQMYYRFYSAQFRLNVFLIRKIYTEKNK